MNPQTLRGVGRLAGQAFALVTVFRTVHHARRDGDKLRLLDAVVNALAVATTVAILVRELRERRLNPSGVERAVDEVAP
ncbi:MAG TPA: hypothetical protein VK908_10505 [Jiangellales bacterium]|jgi:hypothetical protein|nr:hypothetical protein [Jiangellales bacterium]